MFTDSVWSERSKTVMREINQAHDQREGYRYINAPGSPAQNQGSGISDLLMSWEMKEVYLPSNGAKTKQQSVYEKKKKKRVSMQTDKARNLLWNKQIGKQVKQNLSQTRGKGKRWFRLGGGLVVSYAEGRWRSRTVQTHSNLEADFFILGHLRRWNCLMPQAMIKQCYSATQIQEGDQGEPIRRLASFNMYHSAARVNMQEDEREAVELK